MKLIRRLAASFVIISGVCLTPVAGQCEEAATELEVISVSGTVTAIDWVGSVMVLGGDDRFIVPSDAKIFKSDETIAFSEINIGDPVRVKYCKDSNGNNVVKNMEVSYSGDL